MKPVTSTHHPARTSPSVIAFLPNLANKIIVQQAASDAQAVPGLPRFTILGPLHPQLHGICAKWAILGRKPTGLELRAAGNLPILLPVVVRSFANVPTIKRRRRFVRPPG